MYAYDVAPGLRCAKIHDNLTPLTGITMHTYQEQKFNLPERGEGAEVLLARRGMRINLGSDVYFDVLFPDRDVSNADSNDASIVGRLSYKDTHVILTGDAPKWIERHLVSLGGGEIESDILKVGHHGSRTSSEEQFVGFVSPSYAVISAGCDNRYGHPHQDVLDTLGRFGIEVRSTCEEGTILFETDGHTIRPR